MDTAKETFDRTTKLASATMAMDKAIHETAEALAALKKVRSELNAPAEAIARAAGTYRTAEASAKDALDKLIALLAEQEQAS